MVTDWTHDVLWNGSTWTCTPIASAAPFLNGVFFIVACQPDPARAAMKDRRGAPAAPSWDTTAENPTRSGSSSDSPRIVSSLPERTSDWMFGLTDINYLLVGGRSCCACAAATTLPLRA